MDGFTLVDQMLERLDEDIMAYDMSLARTDEERLAIQQAGCKHRLDLVQDGNWICVKCGFQMTDEEYLNSIPF